MGVSQRAANDNQRRRMFKHYDKKEISADNITRDQLKCSCGFKASYQFLRCPECGNLQSIKKDF